MLQPSLISYSMEVHSPTLRSDLPPRALPLSTSAAPGRRSCLVSCCCVVHDSCFQSTVCGSGEALLLLFVCPRLQSTMLTVITLSLHLLTQAEPQPTLLDVSSIDISNVLLLDTFFYVVVFHGTTVAAWRAAEYHLQPEHAAFATLLQVHCFPCLPVSVQACRGAHCDLLR